MKTILRSIIAALFVLTLSSCSSTNGGRIKGQETGVEVQLTKKNYKVIRAGVSGSSSGFKLLGIIPFANPTSGGAKRDLYENVGEPLTGRSIALANQTEDRSTLYLILFSIPKITLTADVIEFTE